MFTRENNIDLSKVKQVARFASFCFDDCCCLIEIRLVRVYIDRVKLQPSNVYTVAMNYGQPSTSLKHDISENKYIYIFIFTELILLHFSDLLDK